MPDLNIVNGEVVIPGRDPAPLDISIEAGLVSALSPRGQSKPAREIIDATGLHIMPGVIDAHIHLGNYQPLEVDAEPGTSFAAIGGVTTLVNYFKANGSYLNLVPELISTYEQHAHIDAAFHLQMLTEIHLSQIAETARQFGITSYKINLVWKGREKQVFGTDRPIDNGWIWAVMNSLAMIEPDKMVLNVHCENQELKNEAYRRLKDRSEPTLSFYEKLAPDIAEVDSMQSVMMLHHRTGVRTYMVHLSSKLAMEALRFPWAQSDRLYKETCIHYLSHTTDSPAGLLATVSPPIRRQEDQDALWEALLDGRLQAVGSDANPILKRNKLGDGDFWSIKPGFDGVGQILPIVLSLGYHGRGMRLGRIAQLLSEEPARIFGLYPQKGSILVGGDADLVLVDLDRRRAVGDEAIGAHCDFSIYTGMELTGWPVATVSRGEVIVREGKILSRPGRGRYLPRKL